MRKRLLFVFALALGFAALGPVAAQEEYTTVPYEQVDRSFNTMGIPGSFDRSVAEEQTRYIIPQGGSGVGGAFFRAEYLHLKPRRRSMDFAIMDPVNQGAEVPEGSIESLEWEHRGGIRAGAGYVLPGSGWDIGFLYTYFHSNDARSLLAPTGGTLLATTTRPGIVDEVTSASATSSLDYDVLDFELGTKIVDSPGATVRVFGGPRIAWIDQKFTAQYDGITAVDSLVDTPLLFDGYGLRLGGESNWQIGAGLSFFTRASGSMLVGDLRSRMLETNAGGAVVVTDLTEKYEKVVPVADVGLGLAWQRGSFRVAVGYEFTNWFGLVETRDFVDDWHESRMSTRTNDLSLDGFFFQLAWVR